MPLVFQMKHDVCTQMMILACLKISAWSKSITLLLFKPKWFQWKISCSHLCSRILRNDEVWVSKVQSYFIFYIRPIVIFPIFIPILIVSAEMFSGLIGHNYLELETNFFGFLQRLLERNSPESVSLWRGEKTVIFSSRTCSNVDLEVGKVICIYPPWYGLTKLSPYSLSCHITPSDWTKIVSSIHLESVYISNILPQMDLPKNCYSA